ncbi:MAG: YdcF family protein, partial [Rubrivivax sp.]|nr:YdcF family protein [Rubrivivax sp.]
MNELFLSLGLASWKPLLAALLFPPLPFLVLVVAGARLMFRRRGLAWLLVLLGVAGVWLGSTSAVGGGLTRWLLKPPPALTESQVAELRRTPR